MVFSWVQSRGAIWVGALGWGWSLTNHVGSRNHSAFPHVSLFTLFFFYPYSSFLLLFFTLFFFLFLPYSSFLLLSFSYFLFFSFSLFFFFPFLKRCPEPHQYWKVNGASVQHYVVESSSPQVVWCRPHKPHYPGSNPRQNHNTAGFKYIFTYLWYWAWRKLNSSLIRSIESTMFSLKGPPCGPVGPPCPPGTYKKERQKKLSLIIVCIWASRQKNTAALWFSGLRLLHAMRQ